MNKVILLTGSAVEHEGMQHRIDDLEAEVIRLQGELAKRDAFVAAFDIYMDYLALQSEIMRGCIVQPNKKWQVRTWLP